MAKKFEREMKSMEIILNSASVLLAITILAVTLLLTLKTGDFKIAFFRETLFGLTVCSMLFVATIFNGNIFMEDPSEKSFLMTWSTYCLSIALLAGSFISNLIAFLMI